MKYMYSQRRIIITHAEELRRVTRNENLRYITQQVVRITERTVNMIIGTLPDSVCTSALLHTMRNAIHELVSENDKIEMIKTYDIDILPLVEGIIANAKVIIIDSREIMLNALSRQKNQSNIKIECADIFANSALLSIDGLAVLHCSPMISRA